MTLVLALMLEWLFGDPGSGWHPVALFGRWASWCEYRLYRPVRARGVITWGLALALPILLLLIAHHMFGWFFDALVLWASIGWKSLFSHVRAVLDAKDVIEARQSVARIVSRDTSQMSVEDAKRAALESLAENASDAVVAPLFWFAVAGPMGAAVYRMINTLDAMWGYRNARYGYFGWWAARIDDWANWLPARLTALLMLMCTGMTSWRDVRRQAVTHASPNAGWPEVALAFAANVRLGGPILRAGQSEDRPWYGGDDARGVDMVSSCDAVDVVRNVLIVAAIAGLGVSFAF